MSAYYWSKLPHSFFDDRRIDSLDPDLYKIFIKLFLLAGIENGDKKTGALPEFDDIVYRLRYWNDEQLETAMVELQGRRLLSMIDGVWYVADFETIQAPEPAKERKRQERIRKAQELAGVTKRDTEEKRREENRSRREEEEKAAAATLPENWPTLFMDDYLKATGEPAKKELAEQAVAKTLDYINGKNYAVKYNFTWIQERYAMLSKTQKADRTYPVPDDYEEQEECEEEDDYSEVPDDVLNNYRTISSTWIPEWKQAIQPVAASDDCITFRVVGKRVDVAEANFGKTLENTYRPRAIAFEAVQ